MKKWYVYEIINLMGTVEYVGETTMPKRRFYSHTKIAPKKGLGAGKFYNRSDIFMNIVCEFDNRKDAFEYQCDLQYQYGLETDKVKLKRNGFQKGHNKGVVRNPYGNPYGNKYANGAPKKSIFAFNKQGKFIGEYKSVTQASIMLGLKQPAISMVLRQTRNHAKGYTFQYKIVK